MAAGMRLVALLKSKNVYLLDWLPFVVAAIAGGYFGMGVKPLPCEGEGVLSLSFLAGLFEGTGGKMAGLLLLLFSPGCSIIISISLLEATVCQRKKAKFCL